ncbi:MAG: CBS domain-containing protein [Gemmatimonadaceae bacterium]
MLARDAMTANPVVAIPEETIARAAEIMRDFDVGAVPVVADRQSLRLVGMLTDRDIAVRCLAAHHTGSCRVRDHMTTGALVTADPGESLEVLVARMERAQVRRVPVLRPDGRLLGIVAQADIATRLGPESPAAVEELLERISVPAGALT